jgi:hypothetical protein
MDKSNRFSLMMEALTELVQEEVAPPPTPKPALPTLASVLADNSPLPSEALYLGQAEDGLPVLLNLHDPVPGPILISADRSSGKTLLLQTIARAADLLHPPTSVQYGIITPRPDEWKALYGGQSNAGIYSTRDENSQELLQSLVTWAHNNKGGDQSVLLMVDDLEAVIDLGEQAQQNLRWLLLRGTSRRVWTFVTLNASRANDVTDWLGFFRTRLFGSIRNPDDAALLTGNRSHTLDHLTPGAEFAMREGNNLLTFWLPSLE